MNLLTHISNVERDLRNGKNVPGQRGNRVYSGLPKVRNCIRKREHLRRMAPFERQQELRHPRKHRHRDFITSPDRESVPTITEQRPFGSSRLEENRTIYMRLYRNNSARLVLAETRPRSQQRRRRPKIGGGSRSMTLAKKSPPVGEDARIQQRDAGERGVARIESC